MKDPEDKNKKEPAFEYVDADSVEFVKRGRKSTIDPTVVQAIAGIPAGKAVMLHILKQDPKSPTYGDDKNKISAKIRAAAKSVGLNVRILWSPDGIPQVKR